MYRLSIGIGNGDCDLIEFNDIIELVDYIDEAVSRFDDRVWILSHWGEIFISENFYHFEDYLYRFINEEKMLTILDLREASTFHLQEYQSYESAYKVALDMREENPLCYDKNQSYEN